MKTRSLILTAGLVGALVVVVIVLLVTTVSVDAPDEPAPTPVPYSGPVVVPPGGECGEAP